MGSGDGWTRCALGHQHWGRYGAAGLLISDGERVILQHRAPWTHEGDSWGVPGGARDAGESAVDAALREAAEEAGLAAADIEPLGLYVVDHGGWSYITVLARPRTELDPRAINAESVEVRWIPIADVLDLVLHGGFAQAWPHLQRLPQRLLVVVGPELSDDPAVYRLRAEGISADAVPTGFDAGSVHRVLVDVRQVADAAEAATLAATVTTGTVVVFDRADLALLT